MRSVYLMIVFCCMALTGFSTTYINVASTAPNDPANWTTTGLAGGTPAANFVTGGDVFTLSHTVTALTGTWDLGAVTLNITNPSTFSGGFGIAFEGTTVTSNSTLTFSTAGNTLTVGDGTNPTSLTMTAGNLAFSNATARLIIKPLGVIDMQGATSVISTYTPATISNDGIFKTASISAAPWVTGKDWTAVNTATGSVELYAAAGQTIIAGTYYDVATSGSGVKSMGAATVRNQLTVGAGTTLTPTAATTLTDVTVDATGAINAGTFTMTVGGNWLNNGTFSAGSSTVNFTGSATYTLAGNMTGTDKFANLTFNNTAGTGIWSFSNDADVNTAFTLTKGTVNGPAGTLNTGSFTQAGTYVAGATTNIDGIYTENTGGIFTAGSGVMNVDGNFIRNGGTFTAGTGTVNLTGAGAQSLPTTATAFSTLNITNGTRTVTMNKGVTVANAFTIPADVTFITTANSLTVNNDFTINGMYMATTQALTVTGNCAVSATGMYTSNSSSTINITGSLTNAGSINDGTGATTIGGAFTNSGTYVAGTGLATTITGNFINSGSYTSTGTTTLNLGGNYNNTGTFTSNTGTVNFTGAATYTLAGDMTGSNKFNNLTFNNAAGTGTWSFSNDADANGIFTLTKGTVTGPAGTLNVGSNFVYTAGAYTAGAITNITGSFTQTAGTFTAGSGVMTVGLGFSETGTFAAGSSTLNVGGNFAKATTGTFTAGTGTVNLNGSGAQAFPNAATTFYTLTLAGGTRTVTTNKGVTVTNALVIPADVTFATAANALTVNSDLTINGAYTATTQALIVTGNLSVTATGTYSSNAASTINVTGSLSNAGTINDGTGATTIGGAFTNSGTYTAGTGLATTITGAFANSGSYTSTGTTTLNLGNSYNNTGTFTSNTGTVNFTGAATYTLAGNMTGTNKFNNLTFNNAAGTGNWSFSNDADVNANLTLTKGTVTGPAATLNVGGNFVHTAATYTAGTATNITGNYSEAATCVFNAGAGTMTVGGNFTMVGGTYTAGSSMLNVGGNFARSGGTFTAGTGTVNMNNMVAASTQTLPGSSATVFNNLTIDNTASRNLTSASGAITVGGAFTLPSGITWTTGAAITMSGGFTNNGTFKPGGQTITVTGNLTNSVSGIYLSTGATVLPVSGSVNNAGTFTGGTGATTVGSSFTNSGTYTTGAASATTVTGNFTNSGTYTATSTSSLNLGNGYDNTGGTFTANTGTVTFNGAAAYNLAGNMTGTSKFNNLVFNNAAGTGAWSMSNDADVNGNFTITKGSVTAPSAGTLKINGNFAKAAAGVFTHNNSLVELAGAGAQAFPGSAVTFYDLKVSNTGGTTTANAATTITHSLATAAGANMDMVSFQLLGAFDAAASNGTVKTQAVTVAAIPSGKTWGGTVQYTANTGAQIVAQGNYNNLTISGTTGTKTTASGTTTVAGNFSLTATTSVGKTTLGGPLDVNGNITITTTAGSGNLDVSASNYQINCGGNWTVNSTSGISVLNNGTGTVIFDGTGTQTISGTGTAVPNFYNATVSNTVNPLVINTNTTLAAAGTFSVAAGAVVSPAAAVVISNNGANAGTITGSGTLQVSRTATTANYVAQYKFTTNTLGALTVDYMATAAQNVDLFTYGTLKTSGSGVKTALGNVTMNAALNVGAATTLDMGTAYRVIAGTAPVYTVDGILKTAVPTATSALPIPAGATWAGAGTVEYSSAASAQTIVGGTYNNLTMDNTSVTDVAAADITVNGTLALGMLNLGANNLFMGTAATLTGASATSYVIATGTAHVRKGFSANGSFAYPIGDASNYTPVSLAVTGGGYSTAYAEANVTASHNTFDLSASNYLNRYWTVGISGITSPSYSATATYVAGDVNGTEANIISASYAGTYPWTRYALANTMAKTVTATAVTTSAVISGISDAADTTIWNGSTWSHGVPDSTVNVVIASTVTPTPATFSAHDVIIDTSVALNTGTTGVVNIYGDVFNNGNGLNGTGTVNFVKTGSSALTGSTISFGGTVTVGAGCTLVTNNHLLLLSRAAYTGRIGTSLGVISGNVSVQRYNIAKRAYRFYGHPFSATIPLSQITDVIDITGGTAANGYAHTSTNNASAFWFDAMSSDTVTVGTNAGWKAFTGPLSATTWNRHQMVRILVRGYKGEGLATGSYTPSATVFTTSGPINQGTQVVTLTKGPNSTFVTCGNPFPSGVQMNTVTKGADIGANYSVWDPSMGTSGAYVSNPFSMSYVLPSFGAISTTATGTSTNTLTFHETDKVSTLTTLFKSTTSAAPWVELQIADSTNNWDRLLISLDDSSSVAQDDNDAAKRSNPGIDFYTLSSDDARLAIDVRPYASESIIPLGLNTGTLAGRYVIKTGIYNNVPVGSKLYLNDKYRNTLTELKSGFEYWFDVNADPATQGEKRFEISMKDTTVTTVATAATMQLFPNPAQASVQVSYHNIAEAGQLTITSVTGQVVYTGTAAAGTGSVTVPLQSLPAGIYMVKLQSGNARFTQKLIKN